MFFGRTTKFTVPLIKETKIMCLTFSVEVSIM